MTRAERHIGHGHFNVMSFDEMLQHGHDFSQIGYGEKNFMADFSTTAEYQKIVRLGYADVRCPTNNLFGLRFEPWHIKIASQYL